MLARCQFTTQQVNDIINKYPAIKLDILNQTQQNALICSNNLLLALSLSEIGDIFSIWNFLCELCSKGINNTDLLELLTSSMWSILRKQTKPIPFVPTIQQIQGIQYLSRNSASEEVRTNCTGMLGILGQQQTQEIKTIMIDIANILTAGLLDNSVVVVAESLNSIFDVFAETDYNVIFNQLNMLHKLSECLNMLRQKVLLDNY